MDEDIRRRPGDDRLSGLPDELLHGILVGLGSVRAAARTSALSRRWRHVWKQIPKLVFFNNDEPSPDLFMDYLDAAIAAHSAPAVELFSIFLPDRVPAYRVAPWLRAAAQRVVGTLNVYLPREMGQLYTLAAETEELILIAVHYKPGETEGSA